MKNKPRLEPEAPPARPTPDELIKKVKEVLAKEKTKKKQRKRRSNDAPSKKMQKAIEYFHKNNIKYIDDVEIGRIYLPQPGMSKTEIKELQDSVKRRIEYIERTLDGRKDPTGKQKKSKQ